MPRVLVVDIGGNHVKVLASGQAQPRKLASGPRLTPAQMVEVVKAATTDWSYEVVAMGYPGPVLHEAPYREPFNLGPGWVGFNFAEAFGRPTRIVNDAVMQALGAYSGGRMLFLGLGTGLGSAMILEGVIAPMELGHLPYKKRRTFEDFVGRAGLERLGLKKWRREVALVVGQLVNALQPEYVVLGGGNARKLKDLPPNARLGGNADAMRGGFRLWAEPAARLAPSSADESPSATMASDGSIQDRGAYPATAHDRGGDAPGVAGG